MADSFVKPDQVGEVSFNSIWPKKYFVFIALWVVSSVVEINHTVLNDHELQGSPPIH